MLRTRGIKYLISMHQFAIQHHVYRGYKMSERRSTKALFLVLLMLTSVIAHGAANETEQAEHETSDEIGTVYGDLSEFDVRTGSQYLLIDEEQPVVSATSFIKQAWIDEGRPGVDKYDTNRRWHAQPVPNMW